MSEPSRILGLSAPVDCAGRTVLVTGATAGVGAATALQIAGMGATLIVVGRDPAKLEATRQTLQAATDAPVHVQFADLADLASVRAATAALSRRFEHIDVVIANAGVLAGKPRETTKDGFESAFGVNHLGAAEFVLGLEKAILAAPTGRVVIVASEAHRRAEGLPLEDLNGERDYNFQRAYARSKLCNILFAKELAKRWPDVRVYAAHPGAVRTAMMRLGVSQNEMRMEDIERFLISPHEAALGVVRVAIDPTESAPSGAYFELGRLNPASPLANDSALASGLWDATMPLLGRDPSGACKT